MLSTFSTELPSDKYPNVTYSLHTLSSSSPEEFSKGSMKSPIEGDPDRVVSLPRSKWDVAAVILVLHHVDDIEGFMTGLTGLVEDGGWVVFTEFTNLGQGHKVSFILKCQYFMLISGNGGGISQRSTSIPSRVHCRVHDQASWAFRIHQHPRRGPRNNEDLARR
jgi:hypothetical protein